MHQSAAVCCRQPPIGIAFHLLTAANFSDTMPGTDFLSALIGFMPVLFIVLLAIFSSAWAFHDARRRGKHPMLVALLVLFVAWPVGLVLWLIFRPEDKGPPRFNLEDYRVR